MNSMKPLLTAAIASMFLAWPHAAPAQENASSASAESFEALRAELSEARTELAAAARRTAEIQRKLGGADALADLRGVGEVDVQRIRIRTDEALERLTDMPPRIGVLLESDDEDTNRVVGLTPGGGAEKAGIRTGDVIVSVNGVDVEGRGGAGIREALKGVEAGETVEVVVQRAGGQEERALGVETSSVQRDVRFLVHRLGKAPEAIAHLRSLDDAGLPMPPAPPLPPRFAALGADTDLIGNHDGLQDYFGTGDGVIVLRIDDDNPLGLRDGDVILTLDREAVNSPVELARQLMRRDSGESVALEVMRNGVLTEVGGEIPERSGPFGHVGKLRIRMPDAPTPPAEPPTAL